MIYKELDLFQSDDKFAKTGRAAEEQMAFYFKRFFANDPDILVLNGIRLEADGDAAQIDHLVIHSHGISIVESKSVHGKIQIKDDGQWIRWFGANQSKGMASPITQARLQEKFFRSVLGKASKKEAFFETFPFDLYVAISDDGVILWPSSGQVQGVCKADQVPDKIVESNCAKAKTRGALELSKENREKIAAFLSALNKPHIRTIRPTASTEPEKEAAPTSAVACVATPLQASAVVSVASTNKPRVCRHCGDTSLELRYAHTYYFFCQKCEKNSSIKAECPGCHGPAKLRKQKKQFFAECEKCNCSTLFFVNP